MTAAKKRTCKLQIKKLSARPYVPAAPCAFPTFAPEISKKWKKKSTNKSLCNHILRSFSLTFFEASFADLDTVSKHVCCGTRKVFFCCLHNLIKHKLNCGPFPWKLIQTSMDEQKKQKSLLKQIVIWWLLRSLQKGSNKLALRGNFRTNIINSNEATTVFAVRPIFLTSGAVFSRKHFTHNDDSTTSGIIRLREVSIFHREFSSRITTSFPVRWLLLRVRVGKHFCHPPSLDYEQHNTQIKYRFCCKAKNFLSLRFCSTQFIFPDAAR